MLELGCGLGLCGLLTSRHAEEVVMTDGVDEVLTLCEANVERNRSLCCANVTCERLRWGDACDLSDIARKHRDGFDVVIGSGMRIPHFDVGVFGSTLSCF